MIDLFWGYHYTRFLYKNAVHFRVVPGQFLLFLFLNFNNGNLITFKLHIDNKAMIIVFILMNCTGTMQMYY